MNGKNLSFFNHFSIYFVGVILLNAVGFVLIPVYTRYLSTAEFGVLELVNRSIEILTIIFVAGLGTTSLSFYSSEKEQGRKDAVISTAVIALFVLSLIGALALQAVARPASSYFFDSHEYLPLFRMASVILVAEVLSIVPLAYLRADMKSKLFVLVSVARFVCVLSINIFLVVIMEMQLKGVILGNMVGSSLFCGILLTYSLSRTRLRFYAGLFKKMLVFGLPFVPSGLFLFIMNNGDRFFIQRFLDNSTLGIYSLGYKIGTLVMLLVFGPFLKIWGPHMFKLDRECTDGERKSFVKFFLYMVLSYCVVALPLAMFSEQIIQLLSAEEYWEASRVVPYVLAAYLFWSMAAFFDSGFYIMRKTIYKPFIMGTATALAVLLYALLIPLYGLMGGAYATMACFGAFSLMTYAVSRRVYPVRYPLNKFAFIFGLGIAIFVLGELIPRENLMVNLGTKAVLAALYPVVILLTGVMGDEVMGELKSQLRAMKRLVAPDPARGA